MARIAALHRWDSGEQDQLRLVSVHREQGCSMMILPPEGPQHLLSFIGLLKTICEYEDGNIEFGLHCTGYIRKIEKMERSFKVTSLPGRLIQGCPSTVILSEKGVMVRCKGERVCVMHLPIIEDMKLKYLLDNLKALVW